MRLIKDTHTNHYMLIVRNIRITRILKNTWKVDIIMLITCSLVYFFHNEIVKYHIDIPAIVPTVMGTAIAFFIGFNNNQAYDRWWEARKIWGAIVNDSRSWARSVMAYTQAGIDISDIAAVKQRLIYRHLAFLYALKAALRGADTNGYTKYLTDEEAEQIRNYTNTHNILLQWQSRDLKMLLDNNSIDGFRFIQMDSLLTKFSDEMGMSERIKKTVFPTTYSYLTKVFIWIFVIAIAFVTSQSMGPWSIFISWLLSFIFVSTQINGMSLVDPFESNVAGIPLNQITRNIEIDLLQMLGEEDVPQPITPVNGEYVL